MLNWWPGILGVLPGVLIGLLNWRLLSKTSLAGNTKAYPGLANAGRLLLLFAAFAVMAWIYWPMLPFMAGGYTIILIFRLVIAARDLR